MILRISFMMEFHQLRLEQSDNARHFGHIDTKKLLAVADQNASRVLGLPASQEICAIRTFAGFAMQIHNGTGQELAHATTEHNVKVLAGHLGDQLGSHIDAGARIDAIRLHIRIALPHTVCGLGIGARGTGMRQGGRSHNARGFAGILCPLSNRGQTIRWVLARRTVVKVHCGTDTDLNDVRLDAAQICRCCAGRVGHLGIGAIGLD